MRTVELYDRLMCICTVILFVMFTILNIPYGGVLLAIMLLVVLFLFAAQHNMKVHLSFTYLHLYMLLLAAFIAISSLWAIVPSYATRRVQPLLEITLAIFFLYACFRTNDGVDKLLKVLMWRGYVILSYIVMRYGFGKIIELLGNDIRIDNEVLNANTIGLMAAYSIVINIYYFTTRKRIKLYDILVVPAFIVLAVSGSRKALVLVVGGILAVFIFRNWDEKRVPESIGKILGVGIPLLMVGYFVFSLPFMEGILGRMDALYQLVTGQASKGVSGYIRFEYVKLGLKLFREHPVVGIGIDNARIFTYAKYGYNHYLHNNYVEILACGGIVGFFFYYWIYFFLIRSFVKYKRYRDAEFDICFILLICALVMEYGMVTYESRETYCMLLLFCLEVDKLRRIGKIDRA